MKRSKKPRFERNLVSGPGNYQSPKPHALLPSSAAFSMEQSSPIAVIGVEPTVKYSFV